MTTTARRVAGFVASVVPLAFLALFFFFPVVNLLARGISDNAGALVDVATSTRLRSVVWFTFWQAVASTAITVLVALPLTWALANYSFRGRRLVQAMIAIPFVLPTVVVAGAFIALMQRFSLEDGAIRLRHTVWVILAAHVFFNVAVVARTVSSFWRHLDPSPEQAAQMLGASPWVAFWRVTAPRLRPAVGSAAAIVFLFTFTSFAIVLLLGGPRRSTIETEIFRYAVTRGDIATAAALAIVQIAAVVALVWVQAALTRRTGGTGRAVFDRSRPVTSRRTRVAVLAAVGATTALLAVPILTLIERSFRSGSGYSLANYRALPDRQSVLSVNAVDAIGNTLVFGAAATAIAVTIGTLASLTSVFGRRPLKQLTDAAVMVPLGTSAVVVGFGILISLDRGPIDLRLSWWIIPITHALIGIPFVARAMIPALHAIPDEVRDAARVLGASPGRVRRHIDAPLARRALATGAGFACAVSLGEFGATSFVGRSPDATTVPLAIGRLLSTPGDALRGQAAALATVLMALTTVIVLVVDHRPHPGSGVL